MTDIKYNAKSAKENNEIGSKIAVLRKKRRLTQSGLARKLAGLGVCVQTPAVTKWENGTTVPNAYQLIALCVALNVTDMIPEFTGMAKLPDFELNEQGLKKLDEYRGLLVASGRYKPLTDETPPACAAVTIPTSYIRAAAGMGNFMDEECFEDMEYPESAVPSGTDFALFVDGESMSPIYINGQVVFVQQCETVRPGQVGIFSIDNEVVIKIYDEQEPDETNKEDFTDSSGLVHPQVVLRSYNSAWAPRPVYPYQEFHVYGRVLN
ncbi:MAG: XRE family transcriptional regulator [Ruminiclostridium sp.]|nr:XRE family transcriptional regulator [Ruminiclostridium sp.]